jgi:chemotaxis protein methyltransferase CheR
VSEFSASLRDRLASADEETRRLAVLSLREAGDSAALNLLNRALGDQSWRVRKAAVTVLRDFPQRRQVVRGLIEALAEPENAGLRSAAVEGLVILGPEAVPQLMETISHPDADVRKFIVDILGEIRDPRAVSAILPLIADPIEVIRLAAVEALGAIGGDRAFASLLQLLVTADVSLQFSVLHALGRIGRPLPFDAIRPLLANRLLRRALFDALGQTQSPEAVEFIVEGLVDSAKSSKQAAIRALHQLSLDPAIVDLARQSVRKRMAAVPLDPFAEFLETPHLPTKRATVTLLSLIGSPQAAAILMRAASDDSIQANVNEALSRMNQPAPAPSEPSWGARAPSPAQPPAQPFAQPPEPTPVPRPVGPMSNPQFQCIRDLVTRESGLYYDRELKYLVERRVQRRMEALALASYDDYFRLLESPTEHGGAERQQLISLLSTNETYFFREDFQLKAFTEEILPALKKRKEKLGSRRLRIWSAGCSSGEEPYTVAILVKETPGFDQFNVDLLASDISAAMVDKARAGLYTNSSFRATPDAYLGRYFRPEGARRRLSEDIVKMVSFDATNLMTCGRAPHLKSLDVIFCRNVIIYFSPEAKLRVVEQFYDLLVPGGYLLLGHSESLMNVSTSFELVHLKHDLVYRKPGGES